MEEVRLSSPEMKDLYLKNIFPNMLSNTVFGLISDMAITNHKHYGR